MIVSAAAVGAPASLPAAPIYAALIAGALALLVQVVIKLWEARSKLADRKYEVLIQYLVTADDFEAVVARMNALKVQAQQTVGDPATSVVKVLQKELQLVTTRAARLQDKRVEVEAGLLLTFSDRTTELAQAWRSTASLYASKQKTYDEYEMARSGFLDAARDEVRATRSVGPTALRYLWRRRAGNREGLPPTSH
ncbi:hypothetical protein [Nocardioides flavescens]|uniref:Uncharacterized protein n=1 Tax=Nocardioides flavescens TaxID=2691959 RepID=A0A6L7F0P8_9ACTN|nr:hypothetical protein [Nocardioides flavescens]MXG88424.1 hypothetical protein [Nocardioides flavescens]